MQIALCSENRKLLQHLELLLEGCRQQRQDAVRGAAFSHSKAFFTALAAQKFDVVLLDASLLRKNGRDLIKKIRSMDSECPLVLMADDLSYALVGYELRLWDYLLKPVTQGQMFRLVDRLSYRCLSERSVLTVKSGTQIVKIPYDQVVYVEVTDKHLHFHLAGGRVYTVRAPLSSYEEVLLKHDGFMKVHRAYVVNFLHMARLKRNEIISYGDAHIPVSRLIYPKARDAFGRYLSAETDVMRIP